MTLRRLALAGLAAGAACTRQPPRPAGPNVVTITATDYAFALPDTIPAGLTTFRLVNQGKELHHASLVRLAAGTGAADFQAGLAAAMQSHAPPPAWMAFVGGPNRHGRRHGDRHAGGRARVVRVRVLDSEPRRRAARDEGDATPAGGHRVRGARRARAGGRCHDHAHRLRLSAVPAADGGAPRGACRQRRRAGARGRDRRPGPGEDAPRLHRLGAGRRAGPAADGTMARRRDHARRRRAFPVRDDAGAGEYLLLCVWPDAKDGKPHIMHGMGKEIRVG